MPIDLITLTYVSTDSLVYLSSIRYHTTEQSSWRYDISIDSVQVDCSIISSGSAECCWILYWSRNSCHPIRKVPLSKSVWISLTTWPPVSDALESSVGSLPNLSDGNDTVVSIDHTL